MDNYESILEQNKNLLERIKELEYAASHDALTGLFNRSFEEKMIEDLLNEDPEKEYILAVIDVDNFKVINDSRGHEFGDTVLKETGRRLRAGLPENCLLFRMGGDEFMVIMPMDFDPHVFGEQLSQLLTWDVEGYIVTVSIGICVTDWTCRSRDELYHRADRALYQAKQIGKNCYQIAQEIEADIKLKQKELSSLQKELQHSRLWNVQYQNAILADAVSYCEVDLTSDRFISKPYVVLNGEKMELLPTLGLADDCTFTEFVNLWKSSVEYSERSRYEEFFNSNHFMDSFLSGKKEESICLWVRDPLGRRQMCQYIFVYSEDETEHHAVVLCVVKKLTPNLFDHAIKNVLVVDDMPMNRAVIKRILGEGYEVIEAEGGKEAISILQNRHSEIDVMLLDILMPEMNGFDVLKEMNKMNIISHIPVIVVSSEKTDESISNAYELGAVDYLIRPFSSEIVRRRVQNSIALYNRRATLERMIHDLKSQQELNIQMVDVLSQIVEFRNSESGKHVLDIRKITECLLDELSKNKNYHISEGDRAIISLGSALHDIGKIGIPESILNKPGKLTTEEFSTMKMHSAIGADILDGLSKENEQPLMAVARDICRWHHERWDGNGYPDRLKENEIPISAQIVSLADVYDALRAERVYKRAYSHEEAMNMIRNGECGVFNPDLIDALEKTSDVIKQLVE